jgi:hypothetical protein
MIDDNEEDYLNDNLLGEEEQVSSPTRKSVDLGRELDSEDQRSYRLVIAIDYGTTFTGEKSLLKIFELN